MAAVSQKDNSGPTQVSFCYEKQNHELSLPEDATVAHNLHALFERDRGTLFRVDKKGLLVKVGWRGWLSYQWNVGAEREKVQAVIERTLKALDGHLKSYADQSIAKQATFFLFDKNSSKGIGRLDQALYNRNLIHGDNTLSQFLLPAQTIRLKIGEDHFLDYDGTQLERGQTPFAYFDLGDKVTNNNLRMILSRKKGQKFELGDPEKLNQKAIERKVQRVVTKTVKKLDGFLARTKVLNQTTQLVLKQIFSHLSPLCRMNRTVFNRGALEEGCKIEKTLFPTLGDKRRALVNALKALRDSRTDKKEVEKIFMDLVFEEFIWSQQRLGIELERNGDGGSGGARYARDRFGREILVVKPGDEGPHGVNNPQWYARFKRWVVSPKACLEGNSEPLAELESYLCDRYFDIWSVPPTELRYVISSDFVGKAVKECSLQMFVEGCTTLGDYIGVTPGQHGLPRSYLRWYCGSETDLGPFTLLPTRSKKRGKMLKKVPQALLQKVAEHNFLIEDTDCHTENILAKEASCAPADSTARRIFQHDATLTDEQIERFVETLFSEKGNQQLLEELLASEEVEVDGEKKKVYLIKHDGGSSNPHSHPSSWDILSLRFKHLFEVLPHFEASFENRKVIDESHYTNYLKEMGELCLKNILGRNEKGNPIYPNFWAEEKNRSLFHDFILKPFEYPLTLITELCITSDVTEETQAELGWYFLYHLKRIHGNIRTRKESFAVLKKHMATTKSMRELFSNVRSQADFERELKA